MLAPLPGQNIIGGDFNCTLQPELDRSTGVDTAHPLTRKLLQCIKDFNLVDVWRNKYSNQRTFSCYSGTHQNFSRIDYYLVSAELIPKISKCWYDSVTCVVFCFLQAWTPTLSIGCSGFIACTMGQQHKGQV